MTTQNNSTANTQDSGSKTCNAMGEKPKKIKKTREEKRAELKEDSELVKALAEKSPHLLEGLKESPTVNEMIIHILYPQGEYNTFKGWLEKGKCVAKGSTGYLVWTKPIKAKKTKKSAAGKVSAPALEKDDTYKLFNVASIFHESQVVDLEQECAA